MNIFKKVTNEELKSINGGIPIGIGIGLSKKNLTAWLKKKKKSFTSVDEQKKHAY